MIATTESEEPMDAPEIHAPHAHPTGHRVFDFVMGGAALFVSCVSLYVAVHHGETMEKLVLANSFPNIETNIVVRPDFGPDTIKFDLNLQNAGVGPARIETLELWSDKKPIGSADALGKAIKALGSEPKFQAQVNGGSASGAFLRAGQERTILSLQAQPREAWVTAFTKMASTLESRTCYCSVLDECYISDSRLKRGRTVHVDACPVPPVPYDDDLTKFLVDRAAPAKAAE